MAPYKNPYYQQVYKPETALKRADELINVGQPITALTNLHEWVVSKKYRQFSDAFEHLMLKLIGLAVEQQKGRMAKEALHAYKNVVLNVSIGSLERVVEEFLRLASEKVQRAQEKAERLTVDLIEDLEASETPESIMLSTVSGQDNRGRTDREVVTPWLKFLWETYRTLLDVLKNNTKLEYLYQSVAKQAFEFCLKFSRKTELRRLCELLRQHLVNLGKYAHQVNAINLNTAESMQMHLDTRFLQLNAATHLELWQEAFRSVEDIHSLMLMSRKPPKPQMVLNFYQRLTQIFLVSDDLVFHAAGWSKYFAVAQSSKSMTLEESTKLASMVMLSALAVPVFGASQSQDDFMAFDDIKIRYQRLAHVLGLTQVPTRASVIKDALSRNLLKNVVPEIKELYEILEVKFHPMQISKKVQPVMEKLVKDPEMAKYCGSLYRVIFARLLQQLSQVYTTLKLDFLMNLAAFPAPYTMSRFEVEKAILMACRRGDLMARIDHATSTLVFDSNLFNGQKVLTEDGKRLQGVTAETMRVQLAELAERLYRIRVDMGDMPEVADKKAMFAELRKQMEDEREAALTRKSYIDRKKEFVENMLADKERQEFQERQLRAQKEAEAEQKRLAEESRRREIERIRREREEIEKQQALKLAEEMAKKNVKIDVEEIENMDKDKLLRLQIQHIEAERKEKENKLNAISKFIDHTERAFRKEEIPLIAQSYEDQKKSDLNHHQEAHALLLEATKRQHAIDIKYKSKVQRIEKEILAFKSSREQQVKAELEKKRTDAAKKLEEAKAARIEKLKQQKKAELEAQHAEEELRRREEEEERAREEERAKAEAARIERLKAEKVEREKQMEEAQERARLQLQREKEAEENRRRREQERLAATAVSSSPQPSRDSGPDWTSARSNKKGGYVPPYMRGNAPSATPTPPPTRAASSTSSAPSSGAPKGKYVPPSMRK